MTMKIYEKSHIFAVFSFVIIGYPDNGTPKESEQDKLVCELAIKF